MAQITINIPDAVAGRVLDAIAASYGWTAESGLTKAQFAKQFITGTIKETVKLHEARQAAVAAERQAKQAVDNDIDIT